MSSALIVSPADAQSRDEWRHLLATADNGTLFHDPTFLDYHPQGRYDWHSLIVRDGGQILAVIPGGLAAEAGRSVFTSPLGASFGGPAVRPGLSTTATIELVKALQGYVIGQGWAGIDMTLPQLPYWQNGQLVDFALHCCGFRLDHRWLCPTIPLGRGDFSRLFRESYATSVRRRLREGMKTADEGIEALPEFAEILDDTYRRHGAIPTHSVAEIRDLMIRFPERVRLHCARQARTVVAGILLFHLTKSVAYSVYICSREAARRLDGITVVFATVIDHLAERGFAWLDLGPSAHDDNVNLGVSFFKKGIGGIGFCRDRWRWRLESK